MTMGSFEKQFVNSSRHEQRVALRAEAMLRHVEVKPGQTYIDVGTGTGAAPIYLAQRYGLQVTGVDLDPEQIEVARRNSAGIPHAEFITDDMTNLNFPDGKFDIVATSKATHHASDWQQAVREMARVLKPGGHLVYMDFSFPGWLAKIGRNLVGDRMSFPNVKTVTRILEEQGMVRIHRESSGLSVVLVYRK